MPADTIAWDQAACRRLMRGGSKSFFAASLLLPGRIRAPATALYAFCRRADDEIDLGTDPHEAMAWLRRRLDGIYAGTPQDIDCDRALAAIVQFLVGDGAYALQRSRGPGTVRVATVVGA